MPDPQIGGALGGYYQGLSDQATAAQAPIRTRLLAAQTGQAELNYRNQLMMMDLLSRHAGDAALQSGNMADRLEGMFNLTFNAGMPNEAMKFANAAGMARTRGMSALATQARLEDTQLRTQLQDAKLQDMLLGGVTDQDTLNAANARYYSLTGRVSPYAGAMYSKGLVDTVREQSQTTQQRISNALRERTATTAERRESAYASYLDFLKQIRQRNQKLQEDREKRLSKAGGRGVRDPGATMITEAGRILKQYYPDMAGDPANLNNAAYSIASRARELQQHNASLGTEAAISRAFMEMNTPENFPATPPGGMAAFFGAKPTHKYSGAIPKMDESSDEGEGSENSPIPLPSSGDASDLELDKWYTDDEGNVKLWTESGWED